MTDAELHGPVIRREVHRMLRRLPPHIERAELVQVAMIRVWLHQRARGPASEGDVRRMTRWAAADFLRGEDELFRSDRRKVRAGARSPMMLVPLDDNELPGPNVTLDEAQARDLIRKARAAIADLPERLRTVLLHEGHLVDLCDVLGLSASRISRLHADAVRLVGDAIFGTNTPPRSTAAPAVGRDARMVAARMARIQAERTMGRDMSDVVRGFDPLTLEAA